MLAFMLINLTIHLNCQTPNIFAHCASHFARTLRTFNLVSEKLLPLPCKSPLGNDNNNHNCTHVRMLRRCIYEILFSSASSGSFFFGYEESARLIGSGSQRRIVSAHKLLHKKLKAGKKREKESPGVVR